MRAERGRACPRVYHECLFGRLPQQQQQQLAPGSNVGARKDFDGDAEAQHRQHESNGGHESCNGGHGREVAAEDGGGDGEDDGEEVLHGDDEAEEAGFVTCGSRGGRGGRGVRRGVASSGSF